MSTQRQRDMVEPLSLDDHSQGGQGSTSRMRELSRVVDRLNVRLDELEGFMLMLDEKIANFGELCVVSLRETTDNFSARASEMEERIRRIEHLVLSLGNGGVGMGSGYSVDPKSF